MDVVFNETTRNNILHNNDIGISNVVCIGYYLDIGDISGSIDSSGRKEVYMKLEQIYKDHADKFFEKQADDLRKLIEAAKNGEQIHMWRSNEPYNLCAFTFLCDLLYEYDCRISCITLPAYYPSWSGVLGRTFKEMLDFEQPLRKEEMNMYKNEWQVLKKENSPLRAAIGGHMVSVPENFYDFLIEKVIPKKDTFSIAEILGAFTGRFNYLGVSYWVYFRVKKMIESGGFNLLSIPDSDRPLTAILRKAI